MLFGTDTKILVDTAGAFITVAGFVVGLGAVTVIQIHGFLGRNSRYWTEATTRTHKVTKPLIWLGLALAVAGAVIIYRDVPLGGPPLIHLALLVPMLIDGWFLSFRVSPFLLQREQEGRSAEILPASWQRKIIIGFIFSFLAWWGQLFLVVWFIVGGYS